MEKKKAKSTPAFLIVKTTGRTALSSRKGSWVVQPSDRGKLGLTGKQRSHTFSPHSHQQITTIAFTMTIRSDRWRKKKLNQRLLF
jgi:hypothetical protein